MSVKLAFTLGSLKAVGTLLFGFFSFSLKRCDCRNDSAPVPHFPWQPTSPRDSIASELEREMSEMLWPPRNRLLSGVSHQVPAHLVTPDALHPFFSFRMLQCYLNYFKLSIFQMVCQREKLVFTKKIYIYESIKPDFRFGLARKEGSSMGELETAW